MKKFLIFGLFCICLTISSCNKEKSLLYYSSKPITRQTFSIETAEVKFKKGERIYYILLNPFKFTCDKAKLSIYKIDIKGRNYTIPEISYTKDVPVNMNKYYITGYFVMNQPGYYMLRVWGYDNLKKSLADSDFLVE